MKSRITKLSESILNNLDKEKKKIDTKKNSFKN